MEAEGFEHPAPACSRCSHTAELHMHGSALACQFCALGALAHAVGIGCSAYTPRTAPRSGASCRMPRCTCEGYSALTSTSAQELLGGGGRQ